MTHLLHMAVFAGIVSVFFATLIAAPGRRFKLGASLWGIMMGVGILLGLIMYPMS